ncbi:hypothetical protein AB0F96_33405, partial [Streptomyces sp. NPDC023998]|uniref:hypothetical protein n=1 Tax=Streptomyces sp. NPDC023998 TaxID=3154597 RepID=UPI0033CEDC18
MLPQGADGAREGARPGVRAPARGWTPRARARGGIIRAGRGSAAEARRLGGTLRRPIFRTSANSSAFAAKAERSTSMASSRRWAV